jgi:enoyl-CoA hydratase
VRPHRCGLWIEAQSERQWMRDTSGNGIAANREAVIARGRTRVS